MADLSKIKIPNGTEYNLKDAQARADIESLNGSLENLETGLTDSQKSALLACFRNVAWINDGGANYYNALRSALNYSNRRPELPDIYEQVEYIIGPSTRTKYIVTDVVSQIPFRVKARIRSVGNGAVVSAGSGGTGRFVPLMRGQPLGQSGGIETIVQRFGNTDYFWIPNHQVQRDEIIDVESNVIAYGNSQVKSSLTIGELYAEQIINTPTGLGTPINIHRLTVDGYISSNSTAIYSIEFYSNATKLFDGITCFRKSDNISGLYDVVSRQFYTGEGSGQYLVGNVVE